ncbi:XdhC family protein [Haliangium ochraceum]|uniref:Xanthine dehydrogenase accessory protein XdhC n=1 Tax=Haliangium ochraceum (strain DSM 14365 / JCM 11303 / SMP-2) TaxID=502025 RepID=D0LWN2_HALO1|nr:XdhC/CoxI family protein [Haliangium ochraceum]ACY17682.1 xanthine dehydrogenase accessory protein XdhC [Haliangium ochraceum DSM 14365]
MELLRQALTRAEAGEALALVTVVAVRGSAPRHLGTKMLVDASGVATGTIGGGAIEREATRLGAEVAAGAPAQRLRQHLVRDLAMCCGGSMELYLEPVAASLDALREALALYDARTPARLITTFDGAPKRVERAAPGAARGPAVERVAPGAAADAGELALPHADERRLIEPVSPPERLVLFGAGHVARAIAPLAAGLEFRVVVCDDDETGALSALGTPPWLTRAVDSFDLFDVEAAIGPLGTGDFVLIVTRDHAVDESILARLLGNDTLSYLGLIGSRGKVGRFRKRLEAKGVATHERWARLHAPIGLDIGAETPAEIAIAVLAQLIHVRRRGARSALDFAPVHAVAPTPPAGAPAIERRGGGAG